MNCIVNFLAAIFLIFGLIIPAFADRVCVVKATGELIEYQSLDAPLGTLVENAKKNGYHEDDIEERYISKGEWENIKQQWIENPAKAEKAVKKANKDAKKVKSKATLKLTEEEWTELLEALGLE